nr:MAG TPA: hypothetical protein [Caudoviricetes sp.]
MVDCENDVIVIKTGGIGCLLIKQGQWGRGGKYNMRASNSYYVYR